MSETTDRRLSFQICHLGKIDDLGAALIDRFPVSIGAIQRPGQAIGQRVNPALDDQPRVMRIALLRVLGYIELYPVAGWMLPEPCSVVWRQ